MKKVIGVGNFLLLFLLPLVFYPPLDEAFVLPKRLVLYLGVLLLLGGMVFSAGQGFKLLAEKKLKTLAVLVLLFLSWFLLSFLFSENRSLGIYDLFEVVPVIILFFIWSSYLEPENAGQGVNFLILAGTLSALYALLQRMGLDPISWDYAELVKSRAIGTLGNPNFLAGFLAVVFPLALGRYFAKKPGGGERGEGAVYLPALVLIALAVILTYTRGGWLALLLGALTFFLLAGKALAKKPALILLLLLLGTFLLVSLKESKSGLNIGYRLKNFLSFSDPSVSTRYYLWKTALKLAGEKPLLGWGNGVYPYLSLKFRENEPLFNRSRLAMPEKVHNDFLELAVSCGFPALLLYLAILLSFFAGILKKLKDSPPEDKLFWAGLGGAGAAFVLQGFFVYSTLAVFLPFWFFLAVVNYQPKPEKGGKFPALVLFLFMLPAFFLTGLNLIADNFYHQALTFRAQNKPQEALLSLNKAMPIYPYKEAYYMEQGKILEEVLHYYYSPEIFKAAVASYRRASELNPLDPYPLADLGRLAGSFMDQDKAAGQIALTAYRTALRLDPYNAFFHNDLANVYANRQEWQEAISHYQRSLAIYPDSALVLTNSARVYVILGEDLKAREQLEKALKLDPKNQNARNILKVLEDKEKSLKD